VNTDQALQAFLEEHRLPSAYRQIIDRWFAPLAEGLAARHATAGRPLLIGINGSQGSGKSTLAALLTILLAERHGLRSIDLSIDDFYLTRAQRQQLAQDVHPLLATRGVPGTHDVALMRDTLQQLMQRQGPVAVPRFDKAADDRLPPAQWPQTEAPLDLVLIEGWCFGTQAQAQAALEAPVNQLESDEDPDGTWRRYVNHAIEHDYQPLYQDVDAWIMLQAPSFDCVYQWRLEQEAKLVEKIAQQGGQGTQLMSAPQLARFIQHYQRLTEHALRTLPAQVDYLYRLDAQRNIISFSQAHAEQYG